MKPKTRAQKWKHNVWTACNYRGASVQIHRNTAKMYGILGYKTVNIKLIRVVDLWDIKIHINFNWIKNKSTENHEKKYTMFFPFFWVAIFQWSTSWWNFQWGLFIFFIYNFRYDTNQLLSLLVKHVMFFCSITFQNELSHDGIRFAIFLSFRGVFGINTNHLRWFETIEKEIENCASFLNEWKYL